MRDTEKFLVNGNEKIKIKDFPTVPYENISKEEALLKTRDNLEKMAEYQDKLYAEGKEGIVFIFQAMDAAGKDSVIKNVMGGLNPQGITVHSFKSPNSEEVSHDFMWRAIRRFPARGYIAIFNRSYYEDVLIVKVHKLYKNYHMPDRCKGDDIIKTRYEDISAFEKYAYNNGYRVIKFFLNVSKEKQKERFLERIDMKIKNWKFNSADVKERMHWDEYMEAYEDAINATATKESPWYIIPADKKWYTRYLVSEAIIDVFEKISPKYPTLPESEQAKLADEREKLMNEDF